MQPPHIAADARNSQETRTVIDQLVEGGIEFFFTRQIDKNTRIEIAAPRAR